MNNTVVVVLGASGGIGRALCEKLQNEDVKHIKVQRISDDKNNNVITLDLLDVQNVTLPIHVMNIMKNAEKVVIIFSNGTIEPLGKIGTFSGEQINQSLYINALGTIQIINECVKNISPEKLYLVQMDSGAAYKPLSGWSLYSAGKAAVSIFLKTLTIESDVKAVCFDPGVVDTGMQQTIRNATTEQCKNVNQFIAYKENGMLHTPADVANRVYERYIANWRAEQLSERYR